MANPDISRQLEEVARSYQYHKPPDVLLVLQEKLAAALRWLYDLLASFNILVPGLADTRAVGDLMQLIVYAAGAAAVLLVIAVAWSRLGQLQSQSALARQGKLSFETVLDAAGWMGEAGLLAERGDYRSACRALYMSMLKLLDERGIAPFAPARTNYEYAYMLSAHPHLQPPFRRLVDRVESVWFGGCQADRSMFSECRELLLSLMEQAGKPQGSEGGTR